MTNKKKECVSKHDQNVNLKELLQDIGWNQYDLAKESGFAIATIHNWAVGKTRTPKIIVKYLRLIKMIGTLEEIKREK